MSANQAQHVRDTEPAEASDQIADRRRLVAPAIDIRIPRSGGTDREPALKTQGLGRRSSPHTAVDTGSYEHTQQNALAFVSRGHPSPEIARAKE